MSTENTLNEESVTESQTQETVKISSLDDIKGASRDTAKLDSDAATSESDATENKESAAPAYTPNWKYKAALQEKEIDEFWRPLVKDAESEKKVKDFLSRVEGLDFVKESRDRIQKEYESLMNDYQSQNEIVRRVETSVQRGDLTSVFRQLGLKNEDVFRWTQEQLQRMEMSPDERRIYEEREKLRAQQYEMENQLSQYQQLYQNQAVQARTMQLDFALSRPEVQAVASQWDSLQGVPGAFKNLVIQEAQNTYFTTGRDISADEAVQTVMAKFGKVLNVNGNQAAPQAATVPGQTLTAPTQKPIIPNVSGKGTAPIKKVPKSLDDLKAMAKEAMRESQI
jgi:hypothetical protein